ncbi:MAG: Tfp pilus assembly protein FimT/FimU, partial [Oligoflexia bacterium]
MGNAQKSGFSLIELLVVAALLGGLGLVTSNLIVSSRRMMVGLEASSQFEDLLTVIRLGLNHPGSCAKMLGAGGSLNRHYFNGQASPTSQQQIDGIYDPAGNETSLFGPGMPGTLALREASVSFVTTPGMTFVPQTWPPTCNAGVVPCPTSPPYTFDGQLTLSAKKGKDSSWGEVPISRQLGLSVTVDQDGQITGCSLISGGSGGQSNLSANQLCTLLGGVWNALPAPGSCSLLNSQQACTLLKGVWIGDLATGRCDMFSTEEGCRVMGYAWVNEGGTPYCRTSRVRASVCPSPAGGDCPLSGGAAIWAPTLGSNLKLKSLTITAIGGGGGGGGPGPTGTTCSSGGGGGSGYVQTVRITQFGSGSPLPRFRVTPGSAGAAGSAGGTTTVQKQNGPTSWVNFLEAQGGGAGFSGTSIEGGVGGLGHWPGQSGRRASASGMTGFVTGGLGGGSWVEPVVSLLSSGPSVLVQGGAAGTSGSNGGGG